MRKDHKHVKEYNHHCGSNDTWIRLFYSSKIFPFHNIDNIALNDLSELSSSSNTDCFCCRNLANSNLDSLPCYEIIASINKFPSLNDIDVDLKQPATVSLFFNTTSTTTRKLKQFIMIRYSQHYILIFEASLLILIIFTSCYQIFGSSVFSNWFL